METLEILVDRDNKQKTYTIGTVYIDCGWFGASIEDVDRGLDDSMTLAEIKARKIYGKTAIPTGRYEVLFTYSAKFAGRTWAKPYGGKVPLISNVKGYEGIRIHPFNTAEDSLGCIAFGINNQKGRVNQSTDYYLRFLKEYFLPAINAGKKVFITIK